MRHAKRRKLTVEDFDKALKWSSVEVGAHAADQEHSLFFQNTLPLPSQPLYGHSTGEPPGFHAIHESGLFSLPNHEVRVADVALASPLEAYPLPQPPRVKGRTDEKYHISKLTVPNLWTADCAWDFGLRFLIEIHVAIPNFYPPRDRLQHP